MMENVEKPAERRVARMLEAFARVLRQVDGQRAVGPEQTEQPHLQPRCRAVVRLERCQRRRRKRQIRILPEAHRLVDRTQRTSPARLRRRTGIRSGAASGRNRTDRARLPALRRSLERRSRAPLLLPSVDFPAVLGPQHGLGERVDRHVPREVSVEDRSEQERAGPLERQLVDLQRRSRGHGRRRADQAHAAGARRVPPAPTGSPRSVVWRSRRRSSRTARGGRAARRPPPPESIARATNS